jgi:2',3'-cyclic-nucleotide 2'-phosphodiesterase (5'-nucleotidase family)
MERRSTVIAQARANAPGPVILIDTGNFMTGVETDTERTKADYVARAMSMMGYDAVNVGRLDAKRPRLAVSGFNKPDQVFSLTSGAFLYDDPQSGQRVFSYPSRIVVTRDSFRVGIIGHPFDDLDQSKLGVENVFDPNPRSLAKLIDDVYTRDRVQMLILITDFSGLREDAEIMAGRYPLISLVIAGESVRANFKEDKQGEEIPVPLVVPKAEAWGRTLGVLDLDLSPTGGITAYHLSYIDIDESVQNDPVLASLTEEYLAKINEEPTGVPQLREAGYVGSKSCERCHLTESEHWQTTTHATAWATLEKTGRLNEASCVPCHTTGYSNSDAFPSRMVPYELQNVGCESCHGPGEVHIQYQEYELYGTITGEEREPGLTDPIVLTPPEEVCARCHQPPYDEGWLYDVKLNRIKHE